MMENQFESAPEQFNKEIIDNSQKEKIISDENAALINQLESEIKKLENSNPELFNKISSIIDIDSLKKLDYTSLEIMPDHIKSIREELESLLAEDEKQIAPIENREKQDSAVSAKIALLGLITLIHTLSATPTVALPEKPAFKYVAKEKENQTLPKTEEIKIDGENYKIGYLTDKKGEFGNFRKFGVFDKNGKNVFPDNESTWKHSIAGYYVGKLSKSPVPEIVVWHEDVIGLEKSNMCANFYQWDNENKKYALYFKDYTDKEFSRNQKTEIVKALFGKPSLFKQAFRIAKEKNPSISPLVGYKPDNRAQMYVFPTDDKNISKRVAVSFINGEIYVKVGPGIMGLPKDRYKK